MSETDMAAETDRFATDDEIRRALVDDYAQRMFWILNGDRFQGTEQ